MLAEENSEEKQMDYANAPQLANEFDKLDDLVNRIEKVIYQR